jgi:hypothetical protein
MARTAITRRVLSANNGIAAPSADTIDQSNGMTLALPSNGIPASPDAEQVVFKVDNSAGSAKNVIIRAGVNPPAFRASIGDLTVSVNTSATAYIGPLESARFAQSDGSISIDFASGFTGTITAFVVPTKF